MSWRFETGGATDGTNELFYESALVDTVFLPRRRVTDPEVRYAWVGLATLSGTREGRAASYVLQADVRLGDKLKSGGWLATWRRDFDRSWRLGADHRFEYRDDRSFDRLARSWRASLGARLRRSWGSSGHQLELGNSLALENVISDTTGFLLGNLLDRVSLAWEHVRLLEREWGLGAQLGSRTFTDSIQRDHLEFRGSARWRQYLGARGELGLELGLTRRLPRRDVPSTRDRYLTSNLLVEGRLRLSDHWLASLVADGNDTRYDEPDDVFFDYAILRGRCDATFEPRWYWSLGAGPRVEWLRARRQPQEEYVEGGGGADLSWARSGLYVTLAPALGWREYLGSGDVGALGVSHSSYRFYEAAGYLDQALPLALRLRGAASARWEQHTNRDDDVTSLYFSLDLRRIF